jgi:thiol:disulfide interchange protein DsbC
MRLIPLILLLMFGLISPIQAEEKSADDAAMKTIGKTLAGITGHAPDLVEASPIPGIYLVAYGLDVFYVSADGKYLLAGEMRELPTMRSVSDDALKRLRKPIMEELAKADSIDYPAKGESKHTITVFTDIDCGYCVKLHRGMKEMNELGISVRYVAYPRAGVGSGSYQKLVNVWCADDQQKSMNISKSGGKLDKAECENPITDHIQLASKLGVSGTPAVFSEDGRQIGGYLPPQSMLKKLNQ